MPSRGMPVLYGAQTVPPALAGGATPAPRGGGGGIPGVPYFSGGNVSGMFGGGISGLNAAYGSQYAASNDFQNRMAQAMGQGWSNTAATQRRGLNAVGTGYDKLQSDVLAGIQGTDAAAKQQIQDSYAHQQGSATQGLINAGLGNSTVTSSVNRGLQADQEKAYVNLANQMAQLSAGYQSQIGQAGLGFKGNAVLANSQLAQNQLGWMNSVNAQYPDAGAYSQLAQMYGAQSQAEKDRHQMMNLYSGMGGGGFGGGQIGGTPGLGYAPTRAPTVGMGNGGGGGVSAPAPMFGGQAASTGGYAGAGGAMGVAPSIWNPYGSAGGMIGEAAGGIAQGADAAGGYYPQYGNDADPGYGSVGGYTGGFGYGQYSNAGDL